jgi:hypothetical protein
MMSCNLAYTHGKLDLHTELISEREQIRGAAYLLFEQLLDVSISLLHLCIPKYHSGCVRSFKWSVAQLPPCNHQRGL